MCNNFGTTWWTRLHVHFLRFVPAGTLVAVNSARVQAQFAIACLHCKWYEAITIIHADDGQNWPHLDVAIELKLTLPMTSGILIL